MHQNNNILLAQNAPQGRISKLSLLASTPALRNPLLPVDYLGLGMSFAGQPSSLELHSGKRWIAEKSPRIYIKFLWINVTSWLTPGNRWPMVTQSEGETLVRTSGSCIRRTQNPSINQGGMAPSPALSTGPIRHHLLGHGGVQFPQCLQQTFQNHCTWEEAGHLHCRGTASDNEHNNQIILGMDSCDWCWNPSSQSMEMVAWRGVTFYMCRFTDDIKLGSCVDSINRIQSSFLKLEQGWVTGEPPARWARWRGNMK